MQAQHGGSTPLPNQSVVSTFQQIRWLFWKNVLRKQRQYMHTIYEFALPMAFIVGLLLIRSSFSDTHVPTQLFTSSDSGRVLSQQALSIVRTAACGCERSLNSFFDGDRANMQAIAFTGIDEQSSVTAQAAMEHVRRRLSALVTEQMVYCHCDSPLDIAVNVVEYINSTSTESALFRSFPTSADMDAYLASDLYQKVPRISQQLDKAFVFSEIGGMANKYQWAYSMRSNGSDLWDSTLTDVTSDAIAYRNKTFSSTFLDSGLLTLQLWVDEYILAQSAPAHAQTVAPLDASFFPMPTSDHTFDGFAESGSQLVGLFFMLSMQWPFARLVKQMVDEKEKKLKEGLHIIGVTDFAYAASWALLYFIGYLILDLGMTILIKLFIFPLCNPILIYIWLLELMVCLMMQAIMCVSIFDSAKLAGLLAPMIVYAQSIPFFAVQAGTASAGVNHLISILPVSALCLGAQQLAHFEAQGTGLQWDVITDSDYHHYSFAASMVWMAVDILLIRLFTAYLDKVVKRQYGAPTERWFFPCQPSYYRRTLCSNKSDSDPFTVRMGEGSDFLERSTVIERVDRLVDHSQTGVSIRSLRKEFEMEVEGETFFQRCCSSKKRPVITAVNNLSMDFAAGEITVLLGHNGAGYVLFMHRMFVYPLSYICSHTVYLFELFHFFVVKLPRCPFCVA
jgi:hypothetical protein